MAVTAEQLNIIIAARDREFQRTMDRAVKTIQTFERQTSASLRTSTTSIERFGARAQRGFQGFSEGVSAATARMAAFAAATAVVTGGMSQVVMAGDQMRQLEARFAAMTGSAERASALMEGVVNAVMVTGGEINSVAAAVARFRLAADAIGATDEEVLRLTENVLMLGRIGGASSEELNSGMMQLAQALASGRLQGDELRSIMETMPMLAQSLASALGVGVGELRNMGSEGKLTSEQVFAALLSQSEQIAEKFRDIPGGVQVATARLSAAWTLLLADIDTAINSSTTWAAIIERVAGLVERAGAFFNPGSDRATALNLNADAAELEALIAERAELSRELRNFMAGKDPGNLGFLDQITFGRISGEMQELNAQIDALQFSVSRLEAERGETSTSGNGGTTTGSMLPPVVDMGTVGGAPGPFSPELMAAMSRIEEFLANGTGVVDPEDTKRVVAGTATVSDYEKAVERLRNRLDEVGVSMDQFQSINAAMTSSLEQGIMSWVEGTASAKDAFRSMARDIVRELYRVLVLQQMIGSLTGGGILGSIGAAFGIPKLPGFAAGGTVAAGQPIITGEHGRELFVPQVDGRVMTAAQSREMMSGSGGGVVVQQTINVSVGVAQTVRAEIASLMPMIAASARGAVLDGKRRGGSYGRALA